VADIHNELEDLERELRESLATRPAPERFTEKVLARVANKEAVQDPRLKRALLYENVLTRVASESRPALFLHWRSALAALLIATVLISAGLWQRRRQQRIAGEHARAQVFLALRITGSALDAILQQKIQHPAKEAQP
jgi:hypothetical protein